MVHSILVQQSEAKVKKWLGYLFVALLFALFVWRQWPSADRSVQFDQAHALDQQLEFMLEGQAKEHLLQRDLQLSRALTHHRRQLYLLAQVLTLPQAQDNDIWRTMADVLAEDEQAWQQSAHFVPGPDIASAVAYQLHQPKTETGGQERWMTVWLWPYQQSVYKVSRVHNGSQQALERQSEFDKLLRWQGKAVQNHGQ